MNNNSLIIGAAAVAVIAGTAVWMTNTSAAKNTATPQASMKPSLPPTAMGELKPSESNIVELVVGNDSFDVLEAAVIKAGLADALSGDNQLTVFAPTDAAFMAFTKTSSEAEAIAAVQSLPVETLSNVLLYHVTEGRKNSQAVMAAPQYTMLNKMQLSQADLTKAGIATTDISASNGIVHVINGVLAPSSI